MSQRRFSKEALAQTLATQQEVVEAGDLSGFVTLVWRKGEVVQLNAIGRRDREAELPMTEDTIFRIASMTKPVTSLAALMLLEEEKLSLASPIKTWLPEYEAPVVLEDPDGPLEKTVPAARDITVEDLLTHRSGIAYGFTSSGPLAQAYQQRLGHALLSAKSPEAWLGAVAQIPLSYQPGERFHYGHSTDVLGLLLARIEGKPLRMVLRERVLEPLGMRDTDFWVPPEKRDRAAQLYQLDPETGLRRSPWADHDAAGPPDFCSGGGGLMSTAGDYLRFAQLLLQGGVLEGRRLARPETIALMHQNRLNAAQRAIAFMGLPYWAGQGFGLGLSVILDPDKQSWLSPGSAGSFGWPGAFGTWWQADPEEDLILLYLIQNEVELTPDLASQLATGQRMGARFALPMFQRAVYGALQP